MFRGAHVLLYAKDADRVRSFFRDTLGFPGVDAGEGWLIFALPPAELGVHPDEEGGRHELHLMCDDVEATLADLRRKGVEITEPVVDRGYGLVTAFRVPGLGELGLYQPRHPTALELGGGPGRRAAKKAASRPKRGARGAARKKAPAASRGRKKRRARG